MTFLGAWLDVQTGTEPATGEFGPSDFHVRAMLEESADHVTPERFVT